MARRLGAPNALLNVERRNHHRFVVHLRGVLIQRPGGLCAEVSVTGVELCSGDAVFAAHAGELHAARDSFDGVVSHCFDCNPRQTNRGTNALRKSHQRWAAKVMRE